VQAYLRFPGSPGNFKPANEALVKFNLNGRLLSISVLLTAAAGYAQDQPAAQPTPQTPPQQTTSQTPAAAARTPPAPKETPSTVNTGGGWSIEPIYWLTTVHPILQAGAADVSTDPGTFAYPDSSKYALGGVISMPLGKTSSLRFSFFQNYKSSSTFAASNLNLFGTAIGGGDFLTAYYRIRDYKVSYDYLTYFFHRGSADFRIKTLWEFQFVDVSNEVDDFSPNGDGTFTVNPAAGTRSIIYPTLGLGFEGTLSRHFRFEAKGSGFALPHRAVLGDGEGSLGLRFGHLEFIVGAKAFHFKTSTKKDTYASGTMYGPYGGIRYYLGGGRKRQR
jgi:hypothetical protein